MLTTATKGRNPSTRPFLWILTGAVSSKPTHAPTVARAMAKDTIIPSISLIPFSKLCSKTKEREVPARVSINRRRSTKNFSRRRSVMGVLLPLVIPEDPISPVLRATTGKLAKEQNLCSLSTTKTNWRTPTVMPLSRKGKGLFDSRIGPGLHRYRETFSYCTMTMVELSNSFFVRPPKLMHALQIFCRDY